MLSKSTERSVDQGPTVTLPLEVEEGIPVGQEPVSWGRHPVQESSCASETGQVGASSCIYLSSGVVIDHNVSCFQEPDYGALYEGRNPGFYVEANPMPTFKVNICPWHRKPQGRRGPLLLGVYTSVFWAHLW